MPPSPIDQQQRITLDASQCPALTNQVGYISLTSRNLRFADFASDGRDLDLYDSDQSTTIAHSIRTWGTGVGLRLIDRIAPPSSSDPHPYIFGIISVAATMGFGHDPHIIRAWGTTLGADTSVAVYGLLRCYDATGALIWTFQSPSHDYPMSCVIADIDGDGIAEVICGARRIDHRGYVLNGTDGTVRWSWDLGTSVSGGPPNSGSYCRVSAAGNLRHDLSGLEVLHGGSDGKLRLADKDGNELWSIVLSQPQPNQSMQDAVIDDLDNSGQAYIYCGQGELIRKIDNAGSTTWTYTHTRSGSYYNNYYAISSGNITSTTTKQIVACSATQDSTNHLGVCTVLDSTGAVVWEKVIPYPCYSVGLGDVNGDGYDEVLLTFGTNTAYSHGDGWGGLLILDRDGNELASTSFGSAAKNTNFGDSNGDGIPEILVSSDDGYHYRYAYESTGATLKATIPSISSASTRNIYAGSAGSTILPPQGDYLFDLSGSDGASPTGWTQQLGVWTIQGGKLQSPNDGDTAAGIRSCELVGSSTDGLELEFTGVKSGQGTGGSTYYLGCRYRCSNWSSGLPDGYYIQVGSNGNCQLLRSTSGTSTPAATIFSSTIAAMAFNATDVMQYRVVVSGIYHSLAYRKNSSPWKIAYEVSDSGGITAAGSIALTSNRGQSLYSSITCWSIPSAFGASFPGPSPIYTAFTGNVSTTTAGKRLLNNGSFRLLNNGSFRLLNGSSGGGGGIGGFGSSGFSSLDLSPKGATGYLRDYGGVEASTTPTRQSLVMRALHPEQSGLMIGRLHSLIDGYTVARGTQANVAADLADMQYAYGLVNAGIAEMGAFIGSYSAPSPTASGVGYAQLQAGGFPAVVEAVMVNSGATAAQIRYTRALISPQASGLVARRLNAVIDSSTVGGSPSANVVADLIDLNFAYAAVYVALGDVIALVNAN